MQLEWRNHRYLAPLLGIVLSAIPQVVFGAQLLYSPATPSCAINAPCPIKILIDPGTDKVNAADGTATFDATLVQVDSVSKDGSSFSLWTSDPSFDNGAGTISFSGGTPSGFSNQGTVVTINFKPKAKGNAKLSFAKGSILAADGKGTDVYKSGTDATLVITDAAPAPAQEDSLPDAAPGALEPAPQVTSPNCSKPEGWYSVSSCTFQWKLLPDVTGVRTLLSPQDDKTPDQLLKPTATSTVVSPLPDGVSFFYVQFKNDSGWGDVAKRQIQIDTVPPNEFDVSLVPADGDPKLAFSTKDDLSGVDRYEIILGSTSAATIKDADLTDGKTPLPPNPGGPTLVTIKAFDKANNLRAATKTLTLPKVDPPKPKGSSTDQPVVQGGAPLWEQILLVLMALAVGALGTLNYNSKKRAQVEKMHVLDEVSAVRDKNDKIFSAMREEFEVMVNDFDPKPQLTPEERDMLEKIKEVLEVSEELIDSTMEELKKTIHGS